MEAQTLNAPPGTENGSVDLELAMRQPQGLHAKLDSLDRLLDYQNGIAHEFNRLTQTTLCDRNKAAEQVRELRRTIEVERKRRYGEETEDKRKTRKGPYERSG